MPLIVPSVTGTWMLGLKYLLVLSFIIFCFVLHYFVNVKVKTPFIDEIFHLNQCKVYCQYRFKEWDNKITTPPGLYLMGMAYSKLLQLILNSKLDLCEANSVLRSLNLVGGILVLPLVLRSINNKKWFWSINIASQPLLFTYYFLFYTDIWSTVFIIISLALILHKPNKTGKYILSAFFGFISLWFRQTNIIWIAFNLSILLDQNIHETNIMKRIIKVLHNLYLNWKSVVPFVIIFLLFGLFLKVNGGITFGDKENHQMNLHVVQIFYCFTFIVFFTLPVWLSGESIRRYIKFLIGNYGLNIIFNGICCYLIKLVIENYTIVHPFLLADNRHFTFYIFKKLICQKYSTFVSVPLYHFSSWLIISTLKELRILSPLTIMSYLVSICLTIVPSPLFEPRYYIVPLVLFRLFIKPTHPNRHILEFCWLNMINAATFYIFFKYEFKWESEPSIIQRIIW